MKRHRATAKHRRGECLCFSHRDCDKAKCKFGGKADPDGYAPFYKHSEIVSGAVVLGANGLLSKDNRQKRSG